MKPTIPILLTAVLCLTMAMSCRQSKVKIVSGKASTAAVPLVTSLRREIPIESGQLEMVRGFVEFKDGFALADPYTNKTCYLFKSNGDFRQKIGRMGQGPGEYEHPMGISVSTENIFVSSASDKKMIRYDLEGNFQSSEFHHITGVITAMQPWGKGFVAAVFSRYSDHVLNFFNEEGVLVRGVFPTPEEIVPFDTFAPAGGLLCSNDKLGVYFNYEYALNWVDEDGKVIEKIQLASPLFIEPDKKAALSVKGARAEIEFRAKSTQLMGFHKLSDSYVTCLLVWETPSEPTYFLEFWDLNFVGKGRYRLGEDETFIGVSADKLLIVDNTAERSQFTFNIPVYP